MSDRQLDDADLDLVPGVGGRGGEPGKSTPTSRLPGRSTHIHNTNVVFRVESAVPQITIVSPAQHGSYDGSAPVEVHVTGTPGSPVALFGTLYSKGKIVPDFHSNTTIGPGGSASGVGSLPITDDGSSYALHVRGSSLPGVFGPLRVVEFQSVIDTKGGGV